MRNILLPKCYGIKIFNLKLLKKILRNCFKRVGLVQSGRSTRLRAGGQLTGKKGDNSEAINMGT